MYKIFEVTYNHGGWHSGPLPHFLYIAKSEEELISNSKKYQQFLEWKELNDGRSDVWIREVSGLEYDSYFENLKEFDVTVSVKKKE